MTISTLADGIREIAEIHDQTRALVKANGFTIADNAGMSAIPVALQTLHAITPDPLWPNLLDGYATGTFRGLVKVEESPISGDNWVALRIVGGEYTVDWGDGTSGTYSNNTQAKHQYTYSNNNLTTVNLFKVAVVTVACTSSITTLDLAQLPNELNDYAGYLSNWLDFAANIPTMTTFNLGQSRDIVRHSNLVRVSSLNGSALTNTSNMFSYCASLVRLPDNFNVPVATNTSLMFYYCTSLVRLPDNFNVPVATNTSNMFSFCTSLVRLPDNFNVPVATNTSNMFSYCASLVRLPDNFNVPMSTNTSGMFSYCASLVRLILPLTTSFTVLRAAMGAIALNDMFTALGNTAGGICAISETPGRLTCTPAIATAKGWTVTT